MLTTTSRNEVVAFSPVATLQRLLFPPVSQQVRRRETGTVHPRLLSTNQVLLPGPPTLLSHISLLQDLPFPTLLLVNYRRPRERMLTMNSVGALMLLVRFWFSLTTERKGK